MPDELDPSVWDDGEQGPSRPLQVAYTFYLKATGDPEFAHLNLGDLVTARSLETWEEQIDEVAEALHGHGIASRTRYLSPIWAKILLPRMPEDAPDEVRYITEPTEMIALAFYVEFVDGLGDWRVHLLGPPDLDETEGLEHLSSEPGGPFSQN